jgi:segregation and condensation protein A
MDGHDPTTVNPSPAPAIAQAVDPAAQAVEGLKTVVAENSANSTQVEVSIESSVDVSIERSVEVSIERSVDVSIEPASMDLNDGVILEDFDVSVVANQKASRGATAKGATAKGATAKASASKSKGTSRSVKFDIPIFGDTPFEQITIESAIENALQAKNVSEGSTEAVSTEMVLTETVSIETSSTAVSIETSSTDVSIESSIESSAAAGVLTVGQSGNPSTGIEASVTEKPVDGIEILIKLAESGDIDPKNIDIIDVTDKFLKAIAAAPKENLRQSGRIIFHASVLLRMKAEALLAAASAELDVGGDDFIDFDEDLLAMDTDQPRQITLKDLEKALVRRTNNKQNRQRKVTLQQLIDALKDAEKLEKERLEKKPRQRIQTDGYIDVRDVEDILELAHDEDIEVTIARVDRLLEESIKIGDALTLLKLIKMLGPKSDWVDAFLAILFLSNAGKIVLEQEEFYGPVHIVRAEPPALGQAFKVTGTPIEMQP